MHSPAELRLLAAQLENPMTHPSERERLGRTAAEILRELADKIEGNTIVTAESKALDIFDALNKNARPTTKTSK